MSEPVPNTRFRLEETFAIEPPLALDSGPEKGLIAGQNSVADDFDAIYVGKHAEPPHRDVWLDIRGAHAVYVMGKRRSGKSYTLGVLAEGLVSRRWVRQGEELPAVVVLDTMNVFLTMPYGAAETLPATDPAFRELQHWKLPGDAPELFMCAPEATDMPVGMPVGALSIRASDLEMEDWCGLFSVDPFVDPMGHLLSRLLDKLSQEGVQIDADGNSVPPSSEYDIQLMVSALEHDPDLQGFPPDTVRALTRRLEASGRSGLFGSAGIDMHSLVRPGAVSVLLLRDLDVELRSVVVSLVVKRLMRLRAIAEQQERLIPIHLARAEKLRDADPAECEQEQARAEQCREKAKAGLPRTWLIIDEAHNYIPATSRLPSRRPLKKYVDEGRNLGLSIVVATQQPSGLDPSIQRNADLLLVHSLSHHDDIAAALGMINCPVPDSITVQGKYRLAGSKAFDGAVRSLPIGYALISSDRANRLFPVRIRPRMTVHGGASY